MEGCREFFEESRDGTVSIDDNGITTFSECDGGIHRVLTKSKGITNDEIAAYIDRCAVRIYEER